jgi:hypothetical protein
VVVAKIKKTLSEKERNLHDIIKDAQRKLDKMKSKQQNEIGELACKNGLNEFDFSLLNESFRNLYDTLKNKS